MPNNSLFQPLWRASVRNLLLGSAISLLPASAFYYVALSYTSRQLSILLLIIPLMVTVFLVVDLGLNRLYLAPVGSLPEAGVANEEQMAAAYRRVHNFPIFSFMRVFGPHAVSATAAGNLCILYANAHWALGIPARDFWIYWLLNLTVMPIGKFLGDGFLAVFGAPVHFADHARRSIAAALEMEGALGEFNREEAESGREGLEIGIGIDTGVILVGNVGSESKIEYAVIGDAVNRASRIEQLNKRLGTRILISESTYRAAGFSPVRMLPPLAVRGFSEPLIVAAIGEKREAVELDSPSSSTRSD